MARFGRSFPIPNRSQHLFTPTILAGSGTGAYHFTGAAAGVLTIPATGTGAYHFAGTAAGITDHPATGVGAFTFTGAAAGSAVVSGTGTGTYHFVGVAVSTPITHGSGTGTYHFTGAAAGVLVHPGSGTGAYHFTGAAAGIVIHPASGQGTYHFAGNAVGYNHLRTFSPPTDAIVPPIYIGGEDPYFPVDPCMQRLMRHYRNQNRGRNIFLMSDGTFVDSQVGGTPPNMIQPPTDPYARAIYESGGALVEQDFFQVPYVVRTYYGGVANQITKAENDALVAAGYVTTP